MVQGRGQGTRTVYTRPRISIGRGRSAARPLTQSVHGHDPATARRRCACFDTSQRLSPSNSTQSPTTLLCWTASCANLKERFRRSFQAFEIAPPPTEEIIALVRRYPLRPTPEAQECNDFRSLDCSRSFGAPDLHWHSAEFAKQPALSPQRPPP